jgi:uncharacterized protein
MMKILEKGNIVHFILQVVPRASQSELTSFQDGVIKLRISAPPVDGKANKECVRVLANFLGIKRSQVTILSGNKSRTKKIAIENANVEEISARLADLPPVM